MTDKAATQAATNLATREEKIQASCDHLLEFKNITSTVQNGEKIIVDNVTAQCRSGQVLAILGPSGAGKTSLLNALTLNATSCHTTGSVTINGENLSQDIFRAHCCIVEQLDIHRAFLTCRETVRYTIDFYEPTMSKEQKEEATNTLLLRLGLHNCADTKVGNAFLQGLSGGQKKRLSVAIALCKKPSVLFLDEPTSGLDAAACSSLMIFIKDLARDFNIAVIATVHQPSSTIYFNFDRVLLLSQGKPAFFGSPEDSVSHFASIGYDCPQRSNPADFLLDAINHEFTDPEAVQKVLDTWKKDGLEKYPDPCCAESMILNSMATSQKGLSWFEEFKFVFLRQLKLVVRDPLVYLGRAIGFLLMCGFFAVIYIEARERSQAQILNRMFVSMWFLGVPTSMGVIAVFTGAEEFKTIEKEVKNGMFRMSTYLLSAFLIQIPASFVLSICALGVPGFAMLDFWSPNFLSFTFLYGLVLFVFECIARCCSVAFENPLLGMLSYLNMWFISFLFSGVMVPEEQVIWPFRAFIYILPLKWAFSGSQWLDVIDSEYTGAYLCEEGSSAGRTDCVFHFDDAGNKLYPGWTCSDTPNGEYNPLQCFGKLGWQVLDSIGMNYKSIESTDQQGNIYLYIIAIGLCAWVMYVFFSFKRLMKVSIVHAVPATTTASKSVEAEGVKVGGFELVSLKDDKEAV